MTKRDFFKMLKISIGLFFPFSIAFTNFPMIMTLFVLSIEWQMFIMLLGGLGLFVLIYVLLLVKTDRIIEALRLDKGFDDSSFNLGILTKQSLAQLAIFIVGLAIMFHVLPDIIVFVNYEFNKFENEINSHFIGALIKFLLPAVLMVNNKVIASFLFK